MVTKGIITSIDFNGNTCKVRIPFFETAGNDPIVGDAIISNTPGIYNGYKVGDVVMVAFEDGQMNNPVILGKLYLGAAKEKQDPRGTINAETTSASKSASFPADTLLTSEVDDNVANTNTPFGSLSSIANNLNSLNVDVNQLDKFTRNQFNSVITDVNEQGEELSEIKQTADRIEANVVRKDDFNQTRGFGWHLDTDGWKVYSTDTGHDWLRDIGIFTVGNSGVQITGNLKILDYPKVNIVSYLSSDDDADADITNTGSNKLPINGESPTGWTAETPTVGRLEKYWGYTVVDNTIVITDDYSTPDYSKKYVWKLACDISYEAVTVDGHSSLKEVVKNITYECLQNVAEAAQESIIPHKKRPITDKALAIAQGKSTNYYNDTDPAIILNDPEDINSGYKYIIKEGDCWFDTGDNHTRVDEAIPKVKNANGDDNDTGYFATKDEYLGYFVRTDTTETVINKNFIDNLIDRDIAPDIKRIADYYTATRDWQEDEFPESAIITDIATADDGYWIELYSTFNNGYETTDRFKLYDTEREGEATLDPNYETWEIDSENANHIFLYLDSPLTDEQTTIVHHYGYDEITSDNIDDLVTIGETIAYVKNQNTLRQWVGANSDQDPHGHWEDIGGELVANKVTANYINAMDITAKRIEVKNGNDTLFLADGLSDIPEVTIASWKVENTTLKSVTDLINQSTNPPVKTGERHILISPEYILNYDPFNADPTNNIPSSWTMLVGDVDTTGTSDRKVGKFGISTAGDVIATSLVLSGGSIELKASDPDQSSSCIIDSNGVINISGDTSSIDIGNVTGNTVNGQQGNFKSININDKFLLSTESSTNTPVTFTANIINWDNYSNQFTLVVSASSTVSEDTTVDVNISYYAYFIDHNTGGIYMVGPDGKRIIPSVRKISHSYESVTFTPTSGTSITKTVYPNGIKPRTLNSLSWSPKSKIFDNITTALLDAKGGNVIFNGNLLPKIVSDTALAFNLGSSENSWNELYVGEIKEPLITNTYWTHTSHQATYTFPYDYPRAKLLQNGSITVHEYGTTKPRTIHYEELDHTDKNFYGCGFIQDYGRSFSSSIPAVYSLNIKITGDWTRGNYYAVSVGNLLEKVFNIASSYPSVISCSGFINTEDKLYLVSGASLASALDVSFHSMAGIEYIIFSPQAYAYHNDSLTENLDGDIVLTIQGYTTY